MKIKKNSLAADAILGGVVLCFAAAITCYSPATATKPTETTYEATTAAVTEETAEPMTKPIQIEVVTEATEPPYSAEDLEHLALVIYQEAGADYISDDTRLMVGTVVMNRVADSRFPDTIEEVLTQKAQYGRLHWTGLVWADRASKDVEAHAVKRAYECAEQILMGYRSFGEDVIWQAEFVQGTEIVAYQDGIYFCR